MRGVEWMRTGALLGSTAAWLTRRPDGVCMAFTFNSLPLDWQGFLNDAITALEGTADAVRAWPAGDLFPAVATPGT